MPRQLTPLTPPTVVGRCPKRHLSLVLIVVVFLLYPVSCQDHRLATFYGAYQRIKPSQTDTGLSIEIHFKTATYTGLLLAARLDRNGSNAGYLAVGISSRHLVTQISQSAVVMTNTSTDLTIERNEWYELSVVMVGTDITVDVGRDGIVSSSHSLTLSSLLTVRDVFLGGANSFFSRVFTNLDVTEYFTGCLANGTFNGGEIDFVPKVEGYGMEYGCCPNPEPITWVFVHGQSNSFVLNSRLVHTRFQTGTLVFSFSIQPENDGMVFYSHDEAVDFALAAEIVNGQLLVHLANEQDHFEGHSLTCEGRLADGWKHRVVIALHEDVLECSVDGNVLLLNASRPTLPRDEIEYHIGSAEVPTSNSNLVLFQTNLLTIPDNNMFPSFGGSLQKFQLNGLDVSPPSLPPGSPPLSSACPHVELPPSCLELQDRLTQQQRAQISVSASTVTLNEGDVTVLTDDQIILNLPDDIAELDVQDSVMDTIHFDVAVPPQYGTLSNASNPHQQVAEFSYSHVVNGSLAYQHNGGNYDSDSVRLNITFACSHARPKFLTLNFSIHLTNDFPVITRQSTLYVAVGTRRAITTDILTVMDEESTNLTFQVVSIVIDDCPSCGAAGRIERVSSPGFNATYFNQRGIDSGDVMFQHFIQHGTQTVTVYLRVSDMFAASIEVELHVEPYVGSVSLTRNEPLPIVQGRCGLISAKHLNATTDFNGQNPILQYSVTSAPKHGSLDVRDQGFWRPVLGPKIMFEGFTQEDIDHGSVRYCPSNNNISVATDVFELRLHSTQLEGGRGNFSINIFAYTVLEKPTVTLTTTPLTLAEGGEVTFLPTTLDVSLLGNVTPPWSREIILIGNFDIFFHLQQLPQFGGIFVDGENLSETDPGFGLDDLIRGGVTYRHDNSENHDDFVSIQVEAKNSPNLPIQSPNLPPVTNVTLTITPVNDHAPEIVTRRISLKEGRFVAMTPTVLNITDDDLPPQTITVTVLNFDPEYGFFARNTTEQITSFSMEEVQAGKVYYHHRLNTSLPLNHTIRIEASDGYTATEQDIEITALPLIIDTRLFPSDECVASLDAVDPILSVPISHVPFLGIEIFDRHGIDTNRLENMVLRVSQFPVHGGLLLGDEVATTFTLSDLRDELVKYNFTNRTRLVSNDTVQIEVDYGHSTPVAIELKICIDPVPTPIQSVLKSITLAPAASVLIDNDTLRFEDSRGRGGERITYRIIGPPERGRVVDAVSVTLTSFTQADIDDNRVFYWHVNRASSSSLHDYFTFRVCTEYVCEGPYGVAVRIFVTNLTVFNFGLTVDEGKKKCITRAHLDIVAPEGGDRIHIKIPPREGQLILNSSGITYKNPAYFSTEDIARGSVCYVHSGSETLNDAFIFNVTATNSQLIPGVFIITVNPINDNEPILFPNEFSTIANTTRSITSKDLSAYDSDSDSNSSNLVYCVIPGSPLYGVIHYRNNPSRTPLDMWYEWEVRAGLLAYTHTATSILRDIIIVMLYDRDQSSQRFIHINIYEIQLNVRQEVLAVDEGGEGIIDRNLLHAESIGDESVNNSNLRFQLRSAPKFGNLTLRGQPVIKFTQEDLITSGLVYQHDHSNTISDNFSYSVTIEQHPKAKETGTFEISINPIDDDAPVLIFCRKPLFVIEGDFVTIISKQIEVIDIDTNMNLPTHTDRIEFQIVAKPKRGDIQRNNAVQTIKGTGFRTTQEFTLKDITYNWVRYESYHISDMNDAVWFDSFTVNLTDGLNAQPTLYNFTFIILPDVVSVQTKSFSVREGGSVVLPNDTITVCHPYLRDQLGNITIGESPSNGSLVNTATGEVNISKFTTDDLAEGNIVYRHNDAEQERDRLTFNYTAHQHNSSNYTAHQNECSDSPTQPGTFPEVIRTSDPVSLDIVVETVNDRGPEIRTRPDNTLVMWAEDCAYLCTSHLDAFDPDTPASKLNYTFNFTFDAYISHTNDSNKAPLLFFTQEDVANHLLKLFHGGGETGTMHYSVTDGHFFASSQLIIETHQLEIVVLRNNPLNVSLNGMVAITANDLKVRESDVNTSILRCSSNKTVNYDFETKYGVIIVDGSSNATSFTDDDIKKGRVFYRHTKPELWEPLETLKLKAKSELTKVKEFNLNITIGLPSEPDSPLAVHKTLLVEEGGQACLNESILDARNIRYTAVKKTYNNTLTSWFQFYYSDDSHGEILVDGKRPPDNSPTVTQAQIANGSVCYRNYGDESPEDPLRFSVFIRDSGEFRRGDATNLVLNISVVLLNDEAPAVTSSNLLMSVVEGFSATIGNNSLLITDEDNPPSDLVFTILSIPAGGHVWFGKKQLQESDNFTQATVNEGKLRFDALDIGTWKVQLAFTDGKFGSKTDFVVEVEELFIKVKRTEVLRYAQNERGAYLTTKHIVTETNGNYNETVYFVAEYPKNGVLKGLRNESFTESDLNTLSVSYEPTNFDSYSDSFKLYVVNRDAENQTATIEVQVSIWGKVQQNAKLEFGSDNVLSLPLPKNILRLSDLQLSLKQPPRIEIIRQPKLGFLEIKYMFPRSRRSLPQNRGGVVFTYDYLDSDWVYYTWNSSNVTLDDPQKCVNDSFSILVEGDEELQPGIAVITLCVKNPPLLTTPPVTPEEPSFSVTTSSPTPFEEEESSSGFPTYALLPILGVFLSLLIIIAVIIVICVTQQGRIRKRWQPRVPRQNWTARGQNFSRHPSSYDQELYPPVEAMTSLTEMVERGNEYHEIRSPISRQSPRSRYSPLSSRRPTAMFPSSEGQSYRRHIIPRPRSRRSNVSVSYSHRPLSDVTLEGVPRSHHHYEFPNPIMSGLTTPVPSGRVTLCRSEYEGGEGESGYLSTPDPSIAAADEPVRLVLRRRPVVEEVSPLPRVLDEASGGNEEVEEEEEEEGEGEMEEEVAVVEGREERGPEPPVNDRVVSEEEHTHAELLATDDKERLSHHEGDSITPSQSDHVAVYAHSNGAHAVSSAPDVPPPDSDTGSSTARQASSSDLHTLFRTHNPILKHTEYWV